MRILIPIVGFGRTGGYRVLSELANAWVKRGHAVSFLVPNSSESPYFPTAATIWWVDGAGFVSDRRGRKAAPTGRYNLTALYRGLKRIGSGYHIVLANHSLTAWPLTLAPCGEAHKFYYVQAYEPEYYLNKGTLRGYLVSLLSALSYHLPLNRIVNSPIYFRYKNLRASECVPPGLDLSIFRPAPQVKDLRSASTIVLGCIGRHEPEKGTYYVLRAFERLCEEDGRYLLRVAYGNLPKNWAHRKCEVVLPRNDSELADYYRSVDILLAPGTVQHGAPHYPVLEGLASGVTIVTTGYLGATQDTSWIVANKNVDSMCNAIRSAVRNHVSRIAKRQKGLQVVQQYSWEQVADQMLLIFAGAKPSFHLDPRST